MTFRAIMILMFEVMMVLINVAETAAVSGGTGAPSYMDCSTLSLNMADCGAFLTTGSTVDTPQGTCCSGLKLEMKKDTECLCEVFRNTAQLGLTLNITRAVGLPAACHVLDPAVSDCGLNSTLLSRGPAMSPRASPPKPSREDASTLTPNVFSPPPTASLSSSPMAAASGSYSNVLLLLIFLVKSFALFMKMASCGL